ncbi:MAG: hypothetical protein JW862_04080 [Anaerolineales bacterium]|nr:hypothetical protein [Anaerolineales bacterium]
MRTIRRIYLYLVAFISLEVIIWGLIGLARTIFSAGMLGNRTIQLASALSLLLVGVPFFLLHWWLAQRAARQDEEEAFSQVRAIFLYGALLAILIPVTQNLIALVNRLLLQLTGFSSRLAFVGADQTWSDNLIAILVNALIGAYLYSIVRQDWHQEPPGNAYADTRRIYRYSWLIYGLGLVVVGSQSLLRFILGLSQAIGNAGDALLPNGLALLLAGIPVWVYSTRLIQHSLQAEAERQSIIRRILLYALSLIGLAGVLVPTGITLDNLLMVLLQSSGNWQSFLAEISEPLSAAIPLGTIWLYYGQILRTEVDALPDTPRRAALRRLYYYILSAFGLGASLIGTQMLLSYLLEVLLSPASMLRSSLDEALAAALATLLVGLPLWILSWRPLVNEAAQAGEPGDHARRSIIRKAYLYLALFVGVIGVMVNAGQLVFNLLSTLLGERPADLLWEVSRNGSNLLIFGALLAYHWRVLHRDQRKSGDALIARQANYPVLILAREIGAFTESLVTAIQREAPGIPIAIHMIEEGAPDESLSEASAVILAADLTIQPSEAIRLWLQAFTGQRLVIPTKVEQWTWIGGSGRSVDSYARQTARTVREFAEGETPGQARETSPWMIVLYVLAGLVSVPILIALISALIDIID